MQTYETAVHGENLLVNDGSDGKTVEAIGKSLPQLDVITSLACGDPSLALKFN